MQHDADAPRVRHPDRRVIAGVTDLPATGVQVGDVVWHERRWCRVEAVGTRDDPLHDVPGLPDWRHREINEQVYESRGHLALVLRVPGHRDLDTWLVSELDPVRVQVWADPDGTTGPLPWYPPADHS